jgi:predicted nucleic acid-binding protein
MSALVDTNVLLRRTQTDHPEHKIAVGSVVRLLAGGESVYFTLQNISEFWNVMTRPLGSNGLGLTLQAAAPEIGKIERILTVLPDSPAVYEEWKRLVFSRGVRGSKVHDAKLVATMNVHGVRRILTFDVGDFARYDIEAVHPASLVP